jgi:DNA-binding HxlR family transcriptional regulator
MVDENPNNGPAAGAARRGSEAPAPGRAVRGSTSGRAIMALLDLLGRRWALRVIWELRGGPLVFRSLQERCEGMSSSVLNERLRELRAAGVVAAGGDGYSLTHEGRRLLEVYAPMAAWADRWEARVRAEGEELPARAPARRDARKG